jgi:uncharacterized repeat protein (TIGR02543 family)
VGFDKNAADATDPVPPNIGVTYDAAYGNLALTTRPGYIFEGWWTEASGGVQISPLSQVKNPLSHALYAHWAADTATEYSITHYKLSGGAYSIEYAETRYGTTGAIVSATPISITGYSFDQTHAGTLLSGAIKGDGSLGLKLYYTANTNITLSFDGNAADATTPQPQSKQLSFDSPYGKLADVTRPGYAFAGWWTVSAASGGNLITENDTVKNAAPHSLYARWTADKGTSYTVEHYKRIGAGQPQLADTDNESGTTDAQVTAIPKNYTGYSLDLTYPGTLETGTINGDGSLILRLYYEAQSNISVSFDKNAADASSPVPADKSVTYDAQYGYLANVTRPGYSFGGWWTNAAGGAEITAASKVTETSNHVLYAHWTADTNTSYTVEHSTVVGQNPPQLADSDKLSGTTGDSVSATPKSYTGYTLDNNFTGTLESANIKGDGSLTLRLYYTAKAGIAVIFDKNAEDAANPNPSQISVTYDAPYGTLATTTRGGYDFAGWWTQPAGGSRVVDSTTVNQSASHTLYARWTARTDTGYSVEHYKVAGANAPQLADTELLTAQTDDAVSAVPKGYTGYTLDLTYPGTMQSGNVKGDGSLTLRLYSTAKSAVKGIFEKNAADATTPVPTSKLVIYDTMYGDLAVTTRPGYAFAGWWTDAVAGAQVQAASKVGDAQDHTLYAHWTAKSNTPYRITHYKLSGGTTAIEYDEILYGVTGTPVSATPMAITGYSFDPAAAGTLLNGSISGDGSLALRLYYTANANIALSFDKNAPDASDPKPPGKSLSFDTA